MSDVKYETWSEVWERVVPGHYNPEYGRYERDESKPPEPMSADEAYALISRTTLIHGGGEIEFSGAEFAPNSVMAPVVQVCVMQLANIYNALINGELPDFGTGWPVLYGSPNYGNVDEVDYFIEKFMVSMNDCCFNEDRQKLIPFIPRLLNTRNTATTETHQATCKEAFQEFVVNAIKTSDSNSYAAYEHLRNTYGVYFDKEADLRPTFEGETPEQIAERFIKYVSDNFDLMEQFPSIVSRYNFDLLLRTLDKMLSNCEKERAAA